MNTDDVSLILRNTAEELSLCGVKSQIKITSLRRKKRRKKAFRLDLQIFDQGTLYVLIYSETNKFILMEDKQKVIEFTCTKTVNSLGIEILQAIERKTAKN